MGGSKGMVKEGVRDNVGECVLGYYGAEIPAKREAGKVITVNAEEGWALGGDL